VATSSAAVATSSAAVATSSATKLMGYSSSSLSSSSTNHNKSLSSLTAYNTNSSDSHSIDIYEDIINLERLNHFESTEILKPTGTQCKQNFYEDVYKKFERSMVMKCLTKVIMSSHYYVLLNCPFYSGSKTAIQFLTNCFVDYGIIAEENSTVIIDDWANTVVETNTKLTLASKWEKTMRQIRQGIMSFQIQNVIAPHPHMFGNSAAIYSQQIFRHCENCQIKTSYAMYHTSYAQDTCREWMSFRRSESKLGIHWEQDDDFIGPFENVVKLRGQLVDFMGGLSIAMSMRGQLPVEAMIAFNELRCLDHNTSKSWMLKVVDYIKKYASVLITAFGDADLMDNGRDIVMQLDDYILRLQMAAMIVPKESVQNIASVAPLQFSDLIVDFNQTILDDNNIKRKVDKNSREFVRELKFDYLSWYHSVS
jgi:hypothetical protein